MPSCRAGSKKFSKMVRSCGGKMKCIRYGDRSMTIKKHIPSRKKSFCARHKCAEKNEPATPGYQSCKKWKCKVGSCRKKSRSKNKKTKRKTTKRKKTRRKSTKRKKTRRKSTKRKKTRRKSTKRKKTRRKSTKRKTTKCKYNTRYSSGRYRKCWSGYKRKGFKTKNGCKVPNCVKA